MAANMQAGWKLPLLLPFILILSVTPPVLLSQLGNVTCKHPPRPPGVDPVYPTDADLLQFALNLEYLEAEWFLFGALGYGLDTIAKDLVGGGPAAIAAHRANIDDTTRRIIEEFGYQEIAHLREITKVFGGFPRPWLDLSAYNFARLFDDAVGQTLRPPFDPYENTINYLLGSYVIPYVGLVGYVGANQNIYGHKAKRILAGVLGIEAGQDAVIRTMLYELRDQVVEPYNITVAEFTVLLSGLRNRLAMCSNKDEGLMVPPELGAENKTSSNVLAANHKSLGHTRTPAQVLRIVYATGDEGKPGGFFPLGCNGKIATDFINTS